MLASTLTLCPSLIFFVPSNVFNTTGSPYSRPITAAWARLPPRSITAPLIKLKTGVQIVAVSLAIIHNQLGEFSHLAPLALWVALIVTLFSGLEYFLRYRKMLMSDARDTGAAAAP